MSDLLLVAPEPTESAGGHRADRSAGTAEADGAGFGDVAEHNVGARP
jgi:hypothetical protein